MRNQTWLALVSAEAAVTGLNQDEWNIEILERRSEIGTKMGRLCEAPNTAKYVRSRNVTRNQQNLTNSGSLREDHSTGGK